jgi:hypothetical protein
MKTLLLGVCLLFVTSFAATVNAGVMLNVALTPAAGFPTSTHVAFDIVATFTSTDGNGDPQTSDFVNSITLWLDGSDLDLIATGFDRFSIDAVGFPWDGAVESTLGFINLTALSSFPNPDANFLFHGSTLTLARLLIDTAGLQTLTNYNVSLASVNNTASGLFNAADTELTNDPITQISSPSISFEVFQTAVVPEPNSSVILGLGVFTVLFGRRTRVAKQVV